VAVFEIVIGLGVALPRLIGGDAFPVIEAELDWGYMYIEGRLDPGRAG
jgi:hypothetical protein